MISRKALAVSVALAVLVLVGCKKEHAYPGYAYVSSDAAGHRLYWSEGSVRWSASDQLAFVSILDESSDGSYSISTMLSDCQGAYMRNDGTAYRKDGSVNGTFAGDKSIVKSGSPSLTAVMNLACKKASDFRKFAGPFDLAQAMTVLYGNFDAKSKSSLWKDVTIPEGMDFINVRNDFQQYRHEKDGLVFPIFDVAYKENGIEKHVLATRVIPKNAEDISYTCNACEALLGAAVFIKDGDAWKLEAANRTTTAAFPMMYDQPKVELFKVGDDRYALEVTEGNMRDGIVSTRTQWLLPWNNSVARAFATNSSIVADPEDTRQIDTCTDGIAKYKLVPNAGSAFFAIDVTGCQGEHRTLNFKDGKFS